MVAHRTSPTNMGLSLLANLSAYDFGYLSAGQLIERTKNAFHTMEALERYQGHFYNWYDTRSLKPLPPLYISSVDSGNLAGHLLTLRPGLLALPDQKILGPRLLEGLGDTLKVLSDIAAATPGMTTPVQLAKFTQLLRPRPILRPPRSPRSSLCLEQLAASAAEVVAEFAGLDADPESPLQVWARALAGQCRAALDELAFFVPWAAWPVQPDDPGDPGREGTGFRHCANWPDLEERRACRPSGGG